MSEVHRRTQKMKNMTIRGIRSSLFSIFLVLAFCSIGIAAADTVVEIDPSTQTVCTGEQFTVEIDITPDVAIGGAQASLTYNPNLVTITNVATGGMFPGFLPGTTDNGAGTVTGIAGYFTGGATTTTPGTLAVITCTAVNPGTSPLNLFDVKVTDGAGVEVPSNPVNGNVVVVADVVCGDVAPHPDGDGVVDMDDVTLLLSHVGCPEMYPISKLVGDVNCDGRIDMGDVILLLNYVGDPAKYPLGCCEE